MELERDLEKLKTSEGHYMKGFLAQCHCFHSKLQAEAFVRRNIPLEDQNFDDKCLSLEQYERMHVVHKNIYLEEDNIRVSYKAFKKLSSEIDAYINKILENLREQFPLDLLQEIDMFDQRTFNDQGSVDFDHRDDKTKLRKLCDFYGLHYNNAVFLSWIALIKTLFQKKSPWCDYKESYPSSFWMGVLGKPDEFEIHPVLRKLIVSAIITPMGKNEKDVKEPKIHISNCNTCNSNLYLLYMDFRSLTCYHKLFCSP